MPDETHRYLIQYESRVTDARAGIQSLMDKLAELRQQISLTSAEWAGLGGPLPTAPAPVTTAVTPISATGLPISPAQVAAMSPEAQQQIAAIVPRMESVTQVTQKATVASGGFAESMEETGRAARRSGHWLGRYIQRYLIRYLVVWQGMVALKAGIRDWIRAHEDLDRAIFRLQTTMGMTITQAEQYIATMRRMGGLAGVPAAQMAMGAMQLGPAAGMAGQFGAMAGMGGQEGLGFFAGIQRQYGLGGEELQELIPRVWAAFARSGEDIQTFLGHWQELVNELGVGSDAVAAWTRALEIYETTGMRATDKVSAAWSDFLGVLGDTQPIIDAKEAIASYFDRLTGKILYTELPLEEKREAERRYYEEMGRQARAGGPFSGFWAWGARGGFAGEAGPVTGVAPSAGVGGEVTTGEAGGMGAQFIDSVQIMTQAQYNQMDRLTQQHEESLAAQGIESSLVTLQIATSTEQGYVIRSIDTTLLAQLLATEDIRDMQRRQMTGVWNFPAGAAVMLTTPQALGQVEFAREEAQRDPNINIIMPEPSPWLPSIWKDWQYGGVVPGQGPRPAIVEGGETILPRGQAALGSVKLHSHLYLNAKEIASDVSTIQGDKLLQAQRASMGTTGGLISI